MTPNKTTVQAAHTLAGESLSALWDHELTALEAHRHKNALQLQDAELATLSRYALMGEALRQTKAGPLVGPDFLAGINQRLDQESRQRLPASGSHRAAFSRPAIAKLALGSAIAASVALVVVGAVLKYQGSYLGSDTSLAALDKRVQILAQTPATQTVNQPESDSRHNRSPRLEPIVEQKLNRYLVSHGEYARGQGQMLPSVSLVSYSNGR